MSPKSDVLLQMFAKAPAPIRDYYGITISNDHVILNIWNISYGPHVYPKKFKTDFSDFLEDKELQYHIGNTFGTHVREFVMGLARKDYNLHYLPTKLFLNIINLLAVRDILNLSQTSKIFFQLCNNNSVWKIICRKQMMNQKFTKQEVLKAEDVGWKQFTKDKIAKRRKAVVALNNNSEKKSSVTKSPNIDIIRNVKPSTMLANIKKSPTKIDDKRTNEQGNLVDSKSPKTDTTRNMKCAEKIKKKESDNSKLNSARNVKSSSIMLDRKKNTEGNKKTEDKHIRSVTDIINVVSTSRAKSSNSIRDKSAMHSVINK